MTEVGQIYVQKNAVQRGTLPTDDEMEYEYWLAGIQGVSSKKKYLLRERMKTGRAVYYIEETQLAELEFLSEKDRQLLKAAGKQKPGDAYAEAAEKGIRFIPWFSGEYPQRLLELTDFPYAIYVKGNLPDLISRKAAIIGSRRCTPYGEKYAVEFGKVLAEYGTEIVSGLARGIDGMGQRGALMGGGRTFAVLGSGPDVCYPREHIGLYMDILEQGGGILSEYPPGTPPLSWHFPARNRIISGLSDVVLVMEAGEKSGSLITVDMALEQGRDIYALPGPVNSSLSRGCNYLIQQGAGLLTSPEMLLKEWGVSALGVPADKGKNKKVLETPEKLVYSCLGLYPKNIEQIAEETKLSPRELVGLLVSLELQGYAREITKNNYVAAET